MTNPIEVTDEDRRNQYRRLYRALLAMDYAEGAQDHDEAEAEAFSIFCDSLDAAEARGAEREMARVVEVTEAAQHLLDVGEFCRTDDTESALRQLRLALSRHADRGEG